MPVKEQPKETVGKVPVQVRITLDLLRDVDHLSVEWNVSRSDAFERLLSEAIEIYRKQGSLWSFSRP